MKRWLFLLALALSTAIAPDARALSPGCDQCADLPTLYRELLEQEFLRNRFERWIREAYYPVTVDEMQRSATDALSGAMSRDLYGVLAPAKSAGGGKPQAAPAYGTDMNSKACGLVEYVKDKAGNTSSKPVTADQVRKKLCAPLAQYTLAHEEHHQASCRAAWESGGAKKLSTVEFFVHEDLAAYQAGIAALREHIASLAKKCSWSGSTNARRPDGTATVPTPAEISKLEGSAKAKSKLLQRASK